MTATVGDSAEKAKEPAHGAVLEKDEKVHKIQRPGSRPLHITCLLFDSGSKGPPPAIKFRCSARGKSDEP